MNLSKLILGTVCCVALLGCPSGGDSMVDAGTDGGQQAQGDSGTPLPTDSGVTQDDAGFPSPDSGVSVEDAGSDAGVVAGTLTVCALCNDQADKCWPGTVCAWMSFVNKKEARCRLITNDCSQCDPGLDMCGQSPILDGGTAGFCAQYGGVGTQPICLLQSSGPHDYVVMGSEVLDRASGLTWSEAYPAATKAQAATMCSGTGVWRIPTFHELYALKDKTKFNPASTFPGMTSEVLWSATDGVNFFSGTVENPATAKFRCVKGP